MDRFDELDPAPAAPREPTPGSVLDAQGRTTERLGILVHGDNHFIVAGPLPDRENAFRLVRQWTEIQIGGVAELPGWGIRTQAFRENLEWAVVVPAPTSCSTAVIQLLAELQSRGVAINRY